MALQSDKDAFLSTLKALGSSAGNTALQRALKWNEARYSKMQRELFAAGLIHKGRGYGGSVKLTEQAVALSASGTAPEDLAEAQAENHASEGLLYSQAKQQLEARWARSRQLDDCHCEITALQGTPDAGESRSRPDLTVIAYRKYEFMPVRLFELCSFEVKPATDVSIEAVTQALAHREAATRSFVIYHTAGQDFSTFAEAEKIEELAARNGVGVYAAKDLTDFSQWAEIATARRATPDPETVDAFIRRVLSEEARTKLREWF